MPEKFLTLSFRPKYKSDFIALIQLSLGLMATVVIFGVSVILMTRNEYLLKGHPSFKYFLPAAVLVTIASLFVARYIHRTRLEFIHVETETTRDRLTQFKAIIFLHHAVCNIPCILNLICFILFGNFVFLAMVAIVFAEMIHKYPSEERVNDAINILPFNKK
jgi:hypothetical protein